MRRSEREVFGEQKFQILGKCDVCRVAFTNDNQPYIVPMNFGYEISGQELTLYFHCAFVGKKMDMLIQNPSVCFEMDCSRRLITGKEACDYTMDYESIIGFGHIEVVTDIQEKRMALDSLMAHYSSRSDFSFSSNHLEKVCILKLTATGYTAKCSNHN